MSNVPYPGLRQFHMNETDIFFGRDEQVVQLLKKLNKSRFLAVVGPSGCGKSSLVQAGMLAGLEIGFLVSAGVQWRTAVMRPGSNPMRNLAAALDESTLGRERTSHEESAAFLLAILRRGPWGLVEALHEKPLPEGTNLLILVDQFEEIFRYRTEYNQNEADAFIALILASAEQRDFPVYVVLTMRSDFLGDCALFMGLPEAMNESQFLTPRLTREQCREAIEGPAAVFGGTVEPSLVNRILNEMGADPDQLPLMQHALSRMWNKAGANPSFALTLSEYKAIGGIANALSNHADEVFDELDEEQKTIAQSLFRSLSECPAGGFVIRRSVKLSKLAAVANVSYEKVISVVNTFRKSDRSFLTPPETVSLAPETDVEISHESLIRRWNRLKKWVEKEADSAKMYRRLEENAQLWKDGKADLWSILNLENALAWKERQQPTKEWAARYGKDFDLAMEFLEESESNRKRELQERTLSLFNSHLTHASLLAKRGVEDYEQARQILSKTYELDKEISKPRRLARNLLAGFVEIMGGQPNRVYEGAGERLNAVAVSPDGRLIAASGDKGILVLFDVDSGQLLKRWEGHDKYAAVKTVGFHPHGKWLASAGDDKRIILWSIPTCEKLREWKAPDVVKALAISPDGTQLVSGGDDSVITLWEPETGKALDIFQGHGASISLGCLAFSPTGERLASGSQDNTARLWEVNTRKPLHILKEHADHVRGISFSKNGKQLATGSRDKTICLWEVDSGRRLRVLLGHQNKVFNVRFIADGRTLISASRDRTLRIWDAESGITLRVLQGHSACVTGVAAYARQLFSAGDDGVVYRWDASLPRQQVVDLPGTAISSVIAPNGDSVAVGFEDGAIRLYSLPDVQLLWEQEKAHDNEIQRIAFNSDGSFLASGSLDKKAKIWNVKEGKLQEFQIFKGHTNAVNAVAFSPDDRVLATAGYDGRIGLFTVKSKERLFFQAHEGRAVSVAFDAAGVNLLSCGYEDCAIRLWRCDAADPPWPVEEFPKDQKNMLLWTAFSPDGNKVAGTGLDFLVHIYATRDRSEQHRLIGHENAILRAIFSNDNQQIATVSADTTVRLWDLNNGTELFSLGLPTDSGWPSTIWDFDFRCTPKGSYWIAAPLRRGKLVLYEFPYESREAFPSACCGCSSFVTTAHMIDDYLGNLPKEDPMYTFLMEHVVRQIMPDCHEKPNFLVYRLGDVQKLGEKISTPAVFRYNDPRLSIDVVGKFYGDRWFPGWEKQDRALLSKLMQQEYSNLLAVRTLGFRQGRFRVVRPWAMSEEINLVLVEEYANGIALDAYLEAAVRNNDQTAIRQRLADVAQFLAELHECTKKTDSVDSTASLVYLRRVIGQLVTFGRLDQHCSERLLALCDKWEHSEILAHGNQVMIHGDAMPGHFIFTDEQLTVLDWERFAPGDAATDLGRMLAEVRYLFVCKLNMPLSWAEKCGEEFLLQYSKHRTGGTAGLTELSRRVNFYIGCDQLRISRNAWLRTKDRQFLITNAKRLLRLDTKETP